MATAIEVSSSRIRLCRIESGRLEMLDQWSVPLGDDPFDTLSQIPVSGPLGAVRLVLHDQDMLLRPLVQPAMEAERLARVIKFELAEMGPEMACTWHIPAVGGTSSDMRILAMIVRRTLIERAQKALKAIGGRLEALVPVASGLYQAWRHQYPDDTSNAVLVDVGGANLHLVLIHDGELVFARTQGPGMDDLVKDVMELRGLELDDAKRLIAKLGNNAPADLLDLVSRHAVGVGTQVANAVRFAKAQLQLDDFAPQAVYLTGAGARLPRFADGIAERAHVPARILNPFAGRIHTVGNDTLDQHAELPSPWAPCIATAGASELPLDAMQPMREERTQWWSTSGVLRVAAAACIAFAAVTAGMRVWRASAEASAISSLAGDEVGQVEADAGAERDLVDRAEAADRAITQANNELNAERQRMRFLVAERRTPRVTGELLDAISSLQHPDTRPLFVDGYAVSRLADNRLRVTLTGYAQPAGSVSSADVLSDFQRQLNEAYPLITRITPGPVEVDARRQPFNWVIEIAAGN